MTAIRLGATRSALYETWQHPELIVIGRSRATSHAMLKTFADDIELNCEPDLSDMNLLIGMKCHYIEVNPRYYSDYVGFALWYYRKRHFGCTKSSGRTTMASTRGMRMPLNLSKNGSPFWAHLHPRRLALDMCITCNYPSHMSKMIQLRHVPDALHRQLKARAAMSGLPLSDYLIREVRKIAEQPTLEEMRERLQGRDSYRGKKTPTEFLRAERDSR